MNSIVLIGSGNVATHLGLILQNKGFIIKQVYSRDIKNAKILATKLNTKFTNNLTNLKEADLFIIAIKDDAIKEIIPKLKKKNIVHTSGSVSINTFNKKHENFGVFYPLQTFNKEIKIELTKTPICIEANNTDFKNILIKIAKKISEQVVCVNSKQRKQIHIAAIFASNFTNHMFTIADKILSKSDLNFSILIPLINKTISKLQEDTPKKIQTGPAKRNDIKIIKSHIKEIDDHDIELIYQNISNNIIKENG